MARQPIRPDNSAAVLLAWPARTRVRLVGSKVKGEAHRVHHVPDPLGNEGYVPAQWLVPAG